MSRPVALRMNCTGSSVCFETAPPMYHRSPVSSGPITAGDSALTSQYITALGRLCIASRPGARKTIIRLRDSPPEPSMRIPSKRRTVLRAPSAPIK